MSHRIPLLAFLIGAAAPASAQVDLIRSGASGAEFRLSIPVPTEGRIAAGERTVAAAVVPGLGPLVEAGYPIVPARRVLLEVPEDGDVALRAVVEMEQTLQFALTE